MKPQVFIRQNIKFGNLCKAENDNQQRQSNKDRESTNQYTPTFPNQWGERSEQKEAWENEDGRGKIFCAQF